MSKSLTKEEMSLNAHVEDLRERMRMLQNDRTANIDVLEANKAANKEEIKRLRGDNKEFRQKLAQLQRVRTRTAILNMLSAGTTHHKQESHMHFPTFHFHTNITSLLLTLLPLLLLHLTQTHNETVHSQ